MAIVAPTVFLQVAKTDRLYQSLNAVLNAVTIVEYNIIMGPKNKSTFVTFLTK